jgi:hypothetical protein
MKGSRLSQGSEGPEGSQRSKAAKVSMKQKLASIAYWDALRRRYPVSSHWELLRQGSGVLAANLLAARALVRGEMQPWELVVLVAFEAIAYTLVAWIQLRFVPPEARPEAEEKKQSLAARLPAMAFGLFWLLCVYGMIFGFFLRDLGPFLAAAGDPLAYLGKSAIRWPLAVALAGLLLDAIADRQFWLRHGGTFVSTPGFTAMARWLTLIFGGIPFFVPLAAGGWGVAQVAKGIERKYGTAGGGPKGGKFPAAILLLPVLGLGLMSLVGWLMQAGELGWTIGYCSAKFVSEMLILGVPLLAERAGREERAALEPAPAGPGKTGPAAASMPGSRAVKDRKRDPARLPQ